MDLHLMVLTADAAQNALVNDYRSLSEGVALCGPLLEYLLDWLAYRLPPIGKTSESPPLPVIRNGQLPTETN